MNDPYFEMLIHEYQELKDIIEEIGPAIADDEEAIKTWHYYTRQFCLTLIANVDFGELEHRAFVNNVSFITDDEMSVQDYQKEFKNHKVSDFNEKLYSDFYIIRKLKNFDLSNLTNYYDRFINFYCTLAEIFSDQSASFRKPVEDFIEKYKYHAESYKNSKNASIGKDSNTRSVPSVHENAVPERVKGEVINTKTPQYSGVQSFPEMDQTYWGKVLIPLFGGVGLLILGIIFHSILMIIIGIIGIIAFFFGLNANSKRCPKCRTWEPRVTVRSEKVGQRKVKVRRGLGSMYFRTSGNNTYGVRQVFVNADEYTYNEVYRCPYCGYETKGTRTAIDDGIR